MEFGSYTMLSGCCWCEISNTLLGNTTGFSSMNIFNSSSSAAADEDDIGGGIGVCDVAGGSSIDTAGGNILSEHSRKKNLLPANETKSPSLGPERT